MLARTLKLQNSAAPTLQQLLSKVRQHRSLTGGEDIDAPNMAQRQHFRLLDLPAELRNEVHTKTFEDKTAGVGFEYVVDLWECT